MSFENNENNDFYFNREVVDQIDLVYLRDIKQWERATEIPMRNFARFLLMQDKGYFDPLHFQLDHYEYWLSTGRYTIKFIAELIHLRHWDLDFDGDCDDKESDTIVAYRNAEDPFKKSHVDWLASKNYDFDKNMKWKEFC